MGSKRGGPPEFRTALSITTPARRLHFACHVLQVEILKVASRIMAAALPISSDDPDKDEVAVNDGAQRSGFTPEEVAQIQVSLEHDASSLRQNHAQPGTLDPQEAAEMERKLEELRALFQSHEDTVRRELEQGPSGETPRAPEGTSSGFVRGGAEERPQVPGTGVESAWLMDESTIDALLTFYALPLTGSSAEKRRRLVDFLGAQIG